jgi:hypothetical protein
MPLQLLAVQELQIRVTQAETAAAAVTTQVVVVAGPRRLVQAQVVRRQETAVMVLHQVLQRHQ